MVADSYSELHEMAYKLGLKLVWFQVKSRWPHYDISKGKRRMAVRLGAIEADERKIIEVAKACAEAHSNQQQTQHHGDLDND